MKTIKTLIITILFTAAAAFAQDRYVVYNADGSITTIVKQPTGTWMVFADKGISFIVPSSIPVPEPPRANPNLTRGIYEEMEAVLEGTYP